MRPVFPDGVSEEGHSNCSRNTGCIMFILNVVQPFFRAIGIVIWKCRHL